MTRSSSALVVLPRPAGCFAVRFWSSRPRAGGDDTGDLALGVGLDRGFKSDSLLRNGLATRRT